MTAGQPIKQSMQNGLGLFHDRDEPLGVTNGNLGQHFAIESDFGLGQSLNEPAIRDSIQATGCGNTRNPQVPEIAFPLFAMLGGQNHGTIHGFHRLAKQFTPGSAETAGLL